MSRLGTDGDVGFFIATLCDHALVEIRCDHDAETDEAVCNCGLVALGKHPSVQKAKEAWAIHVLDMLTRQGMHYTRFALGDPSLPARSPSRTERGEG